MSKKKTNKSKQGKNTSKKRVVQQAPAAKAKKSTSLFTDPPVISSESDPLYRNIFLGLAAFILVVLVGLSFSTGINGDDEYQNDYSEKLVSYYTSFGKDTEALFIEKGNMHLYGGFFDLTTGLINSALGYDEWDQGYHNVRHVFNALFGFLAMLFVGLLAREIGGWRAGILALLFMFLSPRFFGHSLMNPKDIPFAAGFAISLYYMTRLLRDLPKARWQDALGLTLGMALALATRAGGLLLFAYFGLFLGLDFLMKYGIKGLTTKTKELMAYAVNGISVFLASYVLAVLTWPAALVDPIGHPFKALTEFSKLGIKIRLLFQGENVMSDETVWYYPVLWITQTIPLFVLIGLLGAFILLPQLLKRYRPLSIALLFFATLFPVSYIIYKDSILHDGWRHLMFVYPSMVALAALFWVTLEWMFRERKVIQYVLWGALGILALESTIFIVRNPTISYVYFNPIAGGLDGAFGEFETDYWGVAVKQAVNWMEDEGLISESMPDTVFIGTTFYYNVARQSTRKFNDKVRARYVRYYSRYSQDWDYGIFPSRFVRGGHLRAGGWPTTSTIHTVKANGVPLVTIVKNDGKHAFKGNQALKSQNFPLAIQEFQEEVRKYPDNENAWIGLAQANINTGNPQEGLKAAQKVVEIAPDLLNGHYFSGLAYLRMGDAESGLLSLTEAIRIDPKFAAGHYYIALIHQQANRLQDALASVQKAIESNQRFKPAYELAISIFEQNGQRDRANQFRQALQKL